MTGRIVPCLCWIALSFFVMISSYRMGLGGVHSPGPGLMPFLLGVLLLFPSLYLLAQPLLRRREERDGTGWGRVHYPKIGMVLGSLLLFCLLLERLGYLLSMSLFCLALFRIMNNRWQTILIGSALTVSITYFGFTFLGLKLPEGVFR